MGLIRFIGLQRSNLPPASLIQSVQQALKLTSMGMESSRRLMIMLSHSQPRTQSIQLLASLNEFDQVVSNHVAEMLDLSGVDSQARPSTTLKAGTGRGAGGFFSINGLKLMR